MLQCCHIKCRLHCPMSTFDKMWHTSYIFIIFLVISVTRIFDFKTHVVSLLRFISSPIINGVVNKCWEDSCLFHTTQILWTSTFVYNYVMFIIQERSICFRPGTEHTGSALLPLACRSDSLYAPFLDLTSFRSRAFLKCDLGKQFRNFWRSLNHSALDSTST